MFGTHDFILFLIAEFRSICCRAGYLYIVGRSIAQGRWAGFVSVLGISSGAGSYNRRRVEALGHPGRFVGCVWCCAPRIWCIWASDDPQPVSTLQANTGEMKGPTSG
jgi:hypothetical protein